MFNQDSIDVRSLISYVQDIKPYHTKILEVEVEYISSEHVGVGITENRKIDTTMSSVWDVDAVSDGIRTTYRIPPALFPRRTSAIHQCILTGVTDEIPGMPGAYKVPHNVGMIVTVDGVEQTLGTDYTVSANRTIIQFAPGARPLSGSKVCIDTFMLDRVYIALNGVWQSYELLAIRERDGTYYDVDPLDSKFELSKPDPLFYDGTYKADGSQTYSGFSAGAGVPLNHDGEVIYDGSETYSGYLGSTGSVLPTGYDGTYDDLYNLDGEPFDLYLATIGTVKRLFDENGHDYWVFEFFNPPPLDTTITIRVDQRETHAAYSRTTFTETLTFTDYLTFKDSVHVLISTRPPGYDIPPYDASIDVYGFDPIYTEEIKVDQRPRDTAGTSITESLTISIVEDAGEALHRVINTLSTEGYW